MPPASKMIRLLGRRLRGGTIVIEDGSDRWSLGDGDPVVHVTVRDDRAWQALLRKGSVGLGEGYVEGWWDADDLTDLVGVLLVNTGSFRSALDSLGQAATPLVDQLAKLRRRSLAEDRRNVQAHYDLPGELFEVMLDETMTYSCAVFERPGITLADAQRAKFDRLCRKLRLGPDDEVVEIGTGWGGFAIFAAERYGCRLTTTTISDAQREVAAKRVAEAGLADRVTVLGRDYRELEGRYDKLVSIEMIEAVDWRSHDTFFGSCARLLRPHGLMALQAITIADRSYERAKLHDDFIRKMIFPGGCIPSIEAIVSSVRRSTDLTVIDLEDIGRHYAETLRRWDIALRSGRARLEEAGFDRRFRRLWDLYLCYCEAAFLERHISDVQIVFAKPAWRSEPAFELRPV
ncbi:MAG TPA: cyclopropane-fatty-acyl-phospholipid synthase family protein [Acidimicrobiales bacterium]|nr:cyclopropane-fatty-acyl-phospholipid synthase family protein [Acidimicrobiales bacterium]